MTCFGGIICRGCKKDDELYQDNHGIFCHRCGPGVPVERARIVWVCAEEPEKVSH